MTRIAIDLNVRVRGNLTYSGFEDIEGEIPLDGVVDVYEPESGVFGTGRVVEQDIEKRLVYLEVDWAKLRPAPPSDLVPGGGVRVTRVMSYGGGVLQVPSPLGRNMPTVHPALTA